MHCRRKKTEPEEQPQASSLVKGIIIIFLSAISVALSANVLVTTVEIAAARLGVSDAIIAGTIVALGTSLPELSTTYVSARKGFGSLVIGNVIGASILNFLLVLGVSITLVPGGLLVPTIFYQVHFPILQDSKIRKSDYVNKKNHPLKDRIGHFEGGFFYCGLLSVKCFEHWHIVVFPVVFNEWEPVQRLHVLC